METNLIIFLEDSVDYLNLKDYINVMERKKYCGTIHILAQAYLDQDKNPTNFVIGLGVT
jgi:hypothetical protein